MYLKNYKGELVAERFYEYKLHRVVNPNIYLVKKGRKWKMNLYEMIRI